MIRTRALLLALAILLPLAAGAVPATEGEVEHRLERILRQRPTAGALAQEAEEEPALTAESYEQLKEQLLGLLPGDALELVARSLVDRQLQVQLSSRRALVVFQLPLE